MPWWFWLLAPFGAVGAGCFAWWLYWVIIWFVEGA
jgi:hypothetical protein